MVWMTLRLLCMPAQIVQTMSFTQIMDIWRSGRSLEDHLKYFNKDQCQLNLLHTSQCQIISWYDIKTRRGLNRD